MSPTLERDVEAVFSAKARRDRLREIVVEAVESGVPREEVYRLLDDIRLRFRAEGREWEEEIVMDVMDLFHGAAHPRLRV
jgi:hypothetical protein